MTDKTPQEERADYWASVKTMAQEALAAEKDGSDASEFVHESVDGSHYVIYTYANLICLQASQNESAAFDDGNGLEGCNSYGEVMAKLAFYAMRADVEAELAELREASEDEVTP